MNREIPVVVKIAQKRDGESVEAFRPAAQRDVTPHDTGKVRRQQYAVCRDCREARDAGYGGGAKKLTSGFEKRGQASADWKPPMRLPLLWHAD